MTMRALPGPIHAAGVDAHLVDQLRQENEQLRTERDAAIVERDDALADLRVASQAADRLRKSLAPVYDAMRGLFGDLDDLVVEIGPGAPAGSAATPSATTLDVWKQKFPGTPALIIDALALRQTATITQLAAICKRGKATIYDGVYKLKTAGVIQKNGGQFSLAV